MGAGRAGAGLVGRRAFLRAATLLPALPLLAACGWFERAESQPPVATPTSAPTPTVTPTPAPVRLEPPPSVAATAAAPRPAATPAATPTADMLPRTAGQLLYAGTRDGAYGLILADLATGAHRLLARGRYAAPTWSPDGARFAALGIATPEVPTQQLAIFTAEGRALARYSIPLPPSPGGLLSWSPDGRTLLYRFTDPLTRRLFIWLVDDAGRRALDLGGRATPWRWTPESRLAYFQIEGEGSVWTPETIVAVWTVDTKGGNPRREAAGPFRPSDLSHDGAILYATSGLRVGYSVGDQPVYLPTTLLAIDLASGARRTVVDLGTQVGGVWLGAVVIAHGGGPIAIVRRRWPRGTPTPNLVSDLLIVDEGGGGIAQASPWPESDGPRLLEWSPDGRHLAYDASGPGGREIRVVAPFGDRATAYPARVAAALLLRVAWSPDGRWLAFTDSGGITLVPGDAAQERAYGLTADGDDPAWRPGAG